MRGGDWKINGFMFLSCFVIPGGRRYNLNAPLLRLFLTIARSKATAFVAAPAGQERGGSHVTLIIQGKPGCCPQSAELEGSSHVKLMFLIMCEESIRNGRRSTRSSQPGPRVLSGCITQISAVPDKWDLHEGRAVTRQRQKMQAGEIKRVK